MRARKFFAATTSLVGAAPIRLSDVMKEAGWGFDPAADNAIGTVPNMDSFMGEQLIITPLAATMYYGYDEFLDDAAGGTPREYVGAPVAINIPLNLISNSGRIDTTAIFLFSAATQDISIIFLGV